MIEDSLEPRLEELTEDILNLKEGAQSTQPLNTVDVEDQRGMLKDEHSGVGIAKNAN